MIKYFRNEYILCLKILVEYCKMNHNDYEKIFSLLDALIRRTYYDLTFISNFYKYYIFENFTVLEKRGIFNYFLDFCHVSNTKISLRTKVNASFFIIYPMIS